MLPSLTEREQILSMLRALERQGAAICKNTYRLRGDYLVLAYAHIAADPENNRTYAPVRVRIKGKTYPSFITRISPAAAKRLLAPGSYDLVHVEQVPLSTHLACTLT